MLKEGQSFHQRYLRQWPSSCLTNGHGFVPLIAVTQCLGKAGLRDRFSFAVCFAVPECVFSETALNQEQFGFFGVNVKQSPSAFARSLQPEERGPGTGSSWLCKR